jgi:hypothetical protein
MILYFIISTLLLPPFAMEFCIGLDQGVELFHMIHAIIIMLIALVSLICLNGKDFDMNSYLSFGVSISRVANVVSVQQ